MIIGKEYKEKFLSIWNSFLKVNHGQINYGRVLANELAYICHYEVKIDKYSKWKKLYLKRLVFSIFHSKKEHPFEINTNQGSILYFCEEDNRSDYQQQDNFVLKQLNEFAVIEVRANKKDNYKYKRKLSSAFSKIILLFKLVYFTYRNRNNFKHNGISKLIFLYNRALNYYDDIAIINDYIKSKELKLIITFCDVKEYASMITQLGKKYGIKTCTQQHAIYITFNDSNYSQPVINYLNFNSDFILGWGKSLQYHWSKVNFDTNKIVVAGTNISRNLGLINYEIPKTISKNIFSVILSAEYWESSNKSMIEMAEFIKNKYQFDYKILFHPTNEISDYKKDFPFLVDKNLLQNLHDKDTFILENKFLIAHTTSLYLDILRNKKKCFRFVDENFIDIKGIDNDLFEDLNSLENLIQLGFEVDNTYFDKVNEVLEFHYGTKNDSYTKAIHNVINI